MWMPLEKREIVTAITSSQQNECWLKECVCVCEGKVLKIKLKFVFTKKEKD